MFDGFIGFLLGALGGSLAFTSGALGGSSAFLGALFLFLFESKSLLDTDLRQKL